VLSPRGVGFKGADQLEAGSCGIRNRPLGNLSNEPCRLLCSHLEEWVSKVWTSWELWLRGPLQKFPMEGRAPAHPFASVCAKAWPVHTQAYGWVDAACCARVRACVHVCMYARFCVYM
jgi:hypothetical protein